MGEACTLEALTRVTVYEIDQSAFALLLENRPTMAEELAESLSRRTSRTRTTEPQGPQRERHAHVLRKAIHAIFHDRISPPIATIAPRDDRHR